MLINCLMSSLAMCYGASVQRLVHLGVAATLSMGILIVGLLPPNPAGFGTHRSLGLPACLFQKILGIPCPSCGLTTSLAYLLHGDFLASWTAHPAGLFLFAVSLALIIVSVYGMIRPFRWGGIVARPIVHRGVLCSMGIYLATWLMRLMVHSY